MCGGWKARRSGETSLVCCEFLSLVRLLVPGLKQTKNHSTNTDRTRISISISYFSISYTNYTWHLMFEDLPLLKRVRVRFMVFKATQQYFSYILWSVLLVEETRVPDENQQPCYKSLPLWKRKHKWLSNFYFNLNRKFIC